MSKNELHAFEINKVDINQRCVYSV